MSQSSKISSEGEIPLLTRSNPDVSQQSEGVTQPPSPSLTGKHWWLVFAASVVFLNTWGLLLAFGVFQTFYEETLLPHESPSNLSWVSTISAFILLGSGLLTGPLFDYGYLRPLLVGGSLLEVFGLIMLSLSTKYYQVFLSQGICVGLGAGMIFVPSLSAVAVSLDNAHRAKVIGLVSSATGIGGIVYPIVFRRLVTSVSFPWAIRTIAFIMLGLFFLSSPVLYVYRPIKSPLVRSWTDVSAFKDKAFLSVMCGAVFSAMVYYLPMLYLPLYGATAAKVHNDNLSFYLVSIANGASVFGRLLCGLVATAIGPIETCGLAVASSAVILYCWFAVLSPAGVIVWSAAWGFMSSAIVAMPGAIVPHLTPSVTLVGTRTGMLWAAVGVGMLIGSPIAGSLIEYNNGDNIHWWRAQLFASLSMTISAFFFLYSAIFVRIKASSASL